jgi:hypothetical protein
MTAKQLLIELRTAIESGDIDPSDGIHLIVPGGKLQSFHKFDENRFYDQRLRVACR